MSFAHLHTHTAYSLLDGEGTIKKILDRAKELGQTSMAITDHGCMFGVIDFYEYAKSVNEFNKRQNYPLTTFNLMLNTNITYKSEKITEKM